MRVPLVLLPGMNCSTRLWADVADRLAPGHPLLWRPLDRPGLEDQVDALLTGLPPRFAVAGLSLGAIVAMAMHRRAPDRVAGLCLVSTSSRPPTDTQRAAWRSQLDRLASGASARDLQDDLLVALLGNDAPPDLRDLALGMADQVGTRTVANQLRLQGDRVDERPALAGVQVPCTVIAAGGDVICPLDRHTEISRLIEGSELVVIPDAPHLVTLTHPEPVAEAMRGWLSRVES